MPACSEHDAGPAASLLSDRLSADANTAGLPHRHAQSTRQKALRSALRAPQWSQSQSMAVSAGGWRLWRAVGALRKADLPLAPRQRALWLGLVPALAGLVDLPARPVSIIAHAVAALDLDARPRSIWRSVVLTGSHFCFDDLSFLFWRSTVFVSTRARFDARLFLRESIFIFRFWRFRICPRREVPG